MDGRCSCSIPIQFNLIHMTWVRKVSVIMIGKWERLIKNDGCSINFQEEETNSNPADEILCNTHQPFSGVVPMRN